MRADARCDLYTSEAADVRARTSWKVSPDNELVGLAVTGMLPDAASAAAGTMLNSYSFVKTTAAQPAQEVEARCFRHVNDTAAAHSPAVIQYTLPLSASGTCIYFQPLALLYWLGPMKGGREGGRERERERERQSCPGKSTLAPHSPDPNESSRVAFLPEGFDRPLCRGERETERERIVLPESPRTLGGPMGRGA